jgi:enterochelin esterase family protein
VTFRISAPKAAEVTLRGDWMEGTGSEKLTRGDEGVWSVILGPLVPDVYSYSFSVDGVRVVDPRNPQVKEGTAAADSMFEVPGEQAAFLDVQPGPHGDVRMVWYQSTSLARTRRVHIYTPPGYDTSRNRYPVLYLLHGGGDHDSGWSSIGRASMIVDNLLTQGKTKPMLVVMPDGNARDWANATAAGRQTPAATFADDLLKDLIPFVEKRYRLLASRDKRAVMGLSMGGGQALSIGLGNLDKFSYIGILSAGARDQAAFEKQYAKVLASPDTNKRLKLFYIACGVKDQLAYTGSQSLAASLDKHGIKYTFRESSGGHTWINWRHYLQEFAPLLFR